MNLQSEIELNLSEQEKKQLKQIVLARIQVMPEDVNMSIGSEQLTKDELIKHVEKGDEIGKQLISVQLEYLQALASGNIYGNE